MGWLAIDTSDQTCSVAYMDHTMAQPNVFVSDGEEKNTAVLLTALHQVLPCRLDALDALDGVGVTVGPGSFSGVRVGCLMAQTIAMWVQAPVYPFCTCAVWADVAHLQYPEAPVVAVAMDARMQEVYWAVYRYAAPQHQAIEVAPCILPASHVPWPERVSLQQAVLVGSKVQRDHNWLPGNDVDAGPAKCLAPITASVMIDRMQQNTGISPMDAASLRPVYLRGAVT